MPEVIVIVYEDSGEVYVGGGAHLTILGHLKMHHCINTQPYVLAHFFAKIRITVSKELEKENWLYYPVLSSNCGIIKYFHM